jgi:hypothetical protein
LRFSGRLGGKKLDAGEYQLVGTPRAGRRSSVGFRILK